MGALADIFGGEPLRAGTRRGDATLEPPSGVQDTYGNALPPVRYDKKTAHAPAGGVTVGGKKFTGGQFIPAEVMAKATPQEKAEVAGDKTAPKTPSGAQDAGGRPLTPAAPEPAAAGPPPPSREITTTPGLPPAEAEIERASQEYAHTNYPQIREEYLRGDPARGLEPNGYYDPETGELKSVTLNTDEWRALLPGYVGTNAGAVHGAASWLNKMLLWETLREQAGKGNNESTVLAGGGGSGKGTATKGYLQREDTPVILDQVSDNYKKLMAKIDEARAAGFQPTFTFVDRPPGGALAGVTGRALNLRAKGQLARTVSVGAALHANIAARRVALEVLEKNPEVRSSIIDNRGEHDGQLFARRQILDRGEAITYLKSRIAEDEAAVARGLEQRIRADIDRRAHAGEIDPDIATGLLGHGWTRHGPRPANPQDTHGQPLPAPGGVPPVG